MAFSILSEVLREAGITEREALVELACRLFDADRLDFNAASRLAGLDRISFERELLSRGLPVVHYSIDDLVQDRATLEAIRQTKGRA
jgi:predicted HTH domain antitoxin